MDEWQERNEYVYKKRQVPSTIKWGRINWDSWGEHISGQTEKTDRSELSRAVRL